MKKVLALVLVVIIMLGLTPITTLTNNVSAQAGSSQSGNLFINGDFNNAEYGVGNFSTDPGRMEYVPDFLGTGNGCLALYATGAAGDVCIRYSFGDWVHAPLVPGHQYQMSFKVYNPSSNTGNWTWCTMDIQNGDMGKHFIHLAGYEKDKWHTSTTTFTFTGGNDWFRLYASFDGVTGNDDKIYVDDITLIDVTPVSGNWVLGGDFESEYVNNQRGGWHYDGGTSYIAKNEGVNGSDCLALNLLSSGNNSFLTWVSVTPGKTYILSCDVKVPAGSVSWVALDMEGEGTQTWNNGLLRPQVKPIPDTWTTITSYVTIPDNCTSIPVRILAPVCAGAPGNNRMLIDNVSVRCTDTSVVSPYAETYDEDLKGVNLIYNGDFNREGYSWTRTDWGDGIFHWSATAGIDGSGAWVGTAGQTVYDNPCVVSLPLWQGKQLEANRLYEFSVKVLCSEDSSVDAQLQLYTRTNSDPAGWTPNYVTATQKGQWQTLSFKYWTGDNPVSAVPYLFARNFTAGTVVFDDVQIRELGVAERFEVVDLENANLTDISNRVATVELEFDAPMWLGGNVFLCESKTTGGCNTSNRNQYQYDAVSLTPVNGIEQGGKVYAEKWEAKFNLCGCEQHNDLWIYGLPENCVVRIVDLGAYWGNAYDKTIDERMVLSSDVAVGLNGQRVAAEFIDDGMDVAWTNVTNSASQLSAKGVNLLFNGNCNRYGYNWARTDWPGATFTWSATEGVDGSGAWVGTPNNPAHSGCVMAMPAGVGKQLEPNCWYEFSVKVWRSYDCDANVRLEIKQADETWMGKAQWASKQGEWETVSFKYWSGNEPLNIAPMVILDSYTTGTVKIDDFAIRQLGVFERFSVTDFTSVNLNDITNNIATVEIDFGAEMKLNVAGSVFLCNDKNTGGCHHNGDGSYQFTATSLTPANDIDSDGYATKWNATFNLAECSCGTTREMFAYGMPENCVLRIVDLGAFWGNAYDKTLDERMVITADVAVGKNGERIAAEYIDAGMDVAWFNVTNTATQFGDKGVNLLYNGNCNRYGYNWARTDWPGATFTWSATEGVDGSGAWVSAPNNPEQSGCVMAMPVSVGKQLEPNCLYEFSVKIWRSYDCDANVRLEIKQADETWMGKAQWASKQGEWETVSFTYWSGNEPLNVAPMVILDSYTTGTVKIDDFAIRQLGVKERFEIIDLESATLTDISNNTLTVEMDFESQVWLSGNVNMCNSFNTLGCRADYPEHYQYGALSVTPVNGVEKDGKTYASQWVATFKLCSCEQHRSLWANGMPENCVIRITDWMGSTEATENKTLDERMVIAANVAEGINGERIAAQTVDNGMDAAWVNIVNNAPQLGELGENLVRNGDFNLELFSELDFYPTYSASKMTWYPNGGVNDSPYVGLVMPEPKENETVFGCMKYHLNGITDGVELVEGNWYVLSCDVFIPTDAADWMAIDFETSPWDNWGLEPVSSGFANRINTQNSWQHLYVRFKYTGETSMQYLRVFGPTKTAGAEVKIDNVSLKCVGNENITPAFDALPETLDVEKVSVTGENTVTVTFTEENNLTSLSIPFNALDANGKEIASVYVSFEKGADNKTFNGTLVPATNSSYRNFSALWQVAANNNGTMVIDLNTDTALTENDFAFNPNKFEIAQVNQLTSNSLTVKFTENIEFVDAEGFPYVCLRLINTTDGTLAFKGEWPMQWEASSVEFYNDSKDTLLVTFPENIDIGVLVSKINMDSALSLYDVMLCMQEGPASDDFIAANHLVHQIRREGDAKQLEASYKVTDTVSWDAVYSTITLMSNQRGTISVKNVKIIDQTRIVVTFSEAVKLDNPEAYIRLVNDSLNLKVTEDGDMMWSCHAEYYNSSKTQVVFILDDYGKNHPTIPVNGLNDLFSRGYETDGYELRLVVSDTGWKPFHNGIVDSIVGASGNMLLADPMNYDIDSIWLELDETQVPQGELTMVKAEVISDVEGIITFSAPVEFKEWCFFAVRFLDNKDWLVWRTPDGEYSSEGYAVEGSTPMQWTCTWEWNNEEHTQIRFKIVGDDASQMYNFNDLFDEDWAELIEGGHLAIGFEELGELMITDNGRVDNIRLAENSRVALSATVVASDRDGAFLPIEVKYEPRELTYYTEIINESQLRIVFSEPVTVKSNPFIAVRYTDGNNVLIYSEQDAYNKFPLQFNGTWEQESANTYIWTMNGHTYYNTRTLYDVLNFTGKLSQFKDANVRFCIEEFDSETFKTGNNNNAVENISTVDGTNHLKGNRRSGYDGSYAYINGDVLKGDRLTILSAVATDETHIEVTFSEPVNIAEGTSIGVGYVTKNGEIDLLFNALDAFFGGTWEFKDDEHKVITWTLNSLYATKLSDIINYNGNLIWNEGARVAFIINDKADNQAAQFSMRVKGVTTLDGYKLLEANYAKKDCMMAQADIETTFDIPAPVIPEEEPVVIPEVFETNYKPVVIASAAIIAVGLIGMALLIIVRKKEGK